MAKPGRKPGINAISFRLPTTLIHRLDAYAHHVSEETGFRITRTNALIKLLDGALRREEAAIDSGRRPASLSVAAAPTPSRESIGPAPRKKGARPSKGPPREKPAGVRSAKLEKKGKRWVPVEQKCGACGKTGTKITGMIGSGEAVEVCAHCGTPVA